MLKNYFTIILRNLWKNKLYTFINILSLGVGIASIVWGYQNYRYSFSFNKFIKDDKTVFRILTKVKGSDNLKGICPGPVGLFAKNDFSTVKEAVRWDSRGINLKADKNEPLEARAHFTDAHFFNLFNFPLVKGTNEISDVSTVLITETGAKRFFGESNPIDKTILFYSDETYKKPLRVTGVLKDPPINSSFQFEIITNTYNQLKSDGSQVKSDEWSWFANAVFVKLSSPSEAKTLEAKFKKYLLLQQAASQDTKVESFIFQPLLEVGNNTEVDSNALYARPSDSAAYGPLVLAILIFLSACLNFANTSVAQSNRRLKEMGIRKVM